jgi:predicted DNA-binding transcriptional regulator AlpA
MERIMAEYLTQEGVAELRKRAYDELARRNEPLTDREIARLLGISERTFYHLTSSGQRQRPIPPRVRFTLKNVLKFTEEELALYTASRPGVQ